MKVTCAGQYPSPWQWDWISKPWFKPGESEIAIADADGHMVPLKFTGGSLEAKEMEQLARRICKAVNAKTALERAESDKDG